MKKVLLLLAATMLVLSSTAWAATINIIEPLDETLPPTVETSGISVTEITTLPEFAYITGALTGATATNFITSDFYGIKMLEPAFEGGGVSDFAVLAIFSRVAFFNTQPFNLTFLSDGALNFNLFPLGDFDTFAEALAAFDTQVAAGVITEFASIMEDGTLQNLFTFTQTASGLIVNAQSNVIPLPASVYLLGTGLLGLVPYWRLRRQA
jgi:hypothetical protein